MQACVSCMVQVQASDARSPPAPALQPLGWCCAADPSGLRLGSCIRDPSGLRWDLNPPSPLVPHRTRACLACLMRCCRCACWQGALQRRALSLAVFCLEALRRGMFCGSPNCLYASPPRPTTHKWALDDLVRLQTEFGSSELWPEMRARKQGFLARGRVPSHPLEQVHTAGTAAPNTSSALPARAGTSRTPASPHTGHMPSTHNAGLLISAV